ncbi:WecB/TagA/CpsF family glycosyltransferase [Anaerolineales bacterium HSG25]|nr:WecB/TagA/CpsF family glycosyltransferase [Anaerolineales bacterium HSG25]
MPLNTSSSLPRVNILGVGIHAITMTDALQQITAWINQQARAYVSVCTVHTIMECQQNQPMRQAVNQADMATPDGMPLVWLGRHHSDQPVNRVYGPDLLLAMCELSVEHGYRHFFYGGAEGVPQQLARAMQNRFPELQVAGAYSPPFRPLSAAEDAEMIKIINHAQPDIIWVGLGTPKQDLWMAAQRVNLTAPVLLGVGAAFNMHTGQLRQAPMWMQQNGLEWLFRLSQEPSRLWYRYLIYNPLFVLKVLGQMSGWRDYPIM